MISSRFRVMNSFNMPCPTDRSTVKTRCVQAPATLGCCPRLWGGPGARAGGNSEGLQSLRKAYGDSTILAPPESARTFPRLFPNLARTRQICKESFDARPAAHAKSGLNSPDPAWYLACPRPRHSNRGAAPMMNRSRFAVLATAVLLAGGSTAAAQTRHVYKVEDLGSFGGGDLVGVAVNSTGAVTGTATMPDGPQHAFRRPSDGGLEALGTNGGRISQGFAINDNGDVVGVYFDQNWVEHSFIASPGSPMRDLRPDVIQPSAITTDGRLTGMSWYGRAFRTLADGTLQDLSAFLSFGADMNAAGDVAGWGWHNSSSSGPSTAFRYSDAAGYEDLGTLGGSLSYGYGINEHGAVVGTSEVVPGRAGHAFRALPGGRMED